MRVVNQMCAIAGLTLLSVAFSGSATAAGDPVKGQQVFAKCASCHAKDKSNRTGPGLQGIAGRRSGSAPGFHYSRAMKGANITWDDKSLDAFITAPQKLVQGTTMPFAGIQDQQERSDLISYLDTLK